MRPLSLDAAATHATAPAAGRARRACLLNAIDARKISALLGDRPPQKRQESDASHSSHAVNEHPRKTAREEVEDVGLEPTASGLQSRRSSQLSQSPGVVPGGLEPPAPTLSVWCSNRTELQDSAPAGAAWQGQQGLKKGTGTETAPPERRCSSRTFRYGYLVTTSPQSLTLPWSPASDCSVSSTPSGRTNSHGVTGGVYKTRERIHRGMLIRDY